jgi:UTP--glucose-1-phosphate uridylyltransferase
MDKSGQRLWCLYLPGICVHAVPVLPGRHEELHLGGLPRDFHFYHLEPRSIVEEEERLQRFDLLLSLWPYDAVSKQEPETPCSFYTDIHPALRQAYAPSPRSSLELSTPKTTLLSRPPKLAWFSSQRHRPLKRPPIPNFTRPDMPAMHSEASTPGVRSPRLGSKLTNHDDKAFENTSTSVAASQMRNALNQLADTVKDPEEKKV